MHQEYLTHWRREASIIALSYIGFPTGASIIALTNIRLPSGASMIAKCYIGLTSGASIIAFRGIARESNITPFYSCLASHTYI